MVWTLTMCNSTLTAHERLLLETLRLRDLRALLRERAGLLLFLDALLLQGLASDERADSTLGLACEAAATTSLMAGAGVDVRHGWNLLVRPCTISCVLCATEAA